MSGDDISYVELENKSGCWEPVVVILIIIGFACVFSKYDSQLQDAQRRIAVLEQKVK